MCVVYVPIVRVTDTHHIAQYMYVYVFTVCIIPVNWHWWSSSLSSNAIYVYVLNIEWRWRLSLYVSLQTNQNRKIQISNKISNKNGFFCRFHCHVNHQIIKSINRLRLHDIEWFGLLLMLFSLTNIHVKDCMESVNWVWINKKQRKRKMKWET